MIIRDSDAFFSFGLRCYLESEFSMRYVTGRGRAYDPMNQIDVIFQMVESETDCLLALSGICERFSGVVFFIMRSPGKTGCNICLKHFPVIYRADSFVTVRQKISRQLKLWQQADCDGAVPSICVACGRPKLTTNEIKVLSLLAKELSLTKVALVLGKNIKTVFTQKKSAMNKLGLKNSYELSLFIIKHRRVLSVL